MSACQSCRSLLTEALDLSVRARKLDAMVERALAAGRGRCGTPAIWVMDQYDRDLAAWEERSRLHLSQACGSISQGL